MVRKWLYSFLYSTCVTKKIWQWYLWNLWSYRKTKEVFSKSTIKYNTGISFCGIGDPDSFKETLNKLSINIIKSLQFKDHQNYSSSIIKKIEESLKKTNQNTFFTTEKDWVKLPNDFIEKYNGCYIKMETCIEDDSFYTIMNNSLQ